MIDLHNKDAFDFLASAGDCSVDLVLTDPPYESLEKWRKMGTTTRLKKSKQSNNSWFNIIPNSSLPRLFSEFYRVLKNDRHLYLMCDHETMIDARQAGIDAGFKFWKPLIWDKEAIGMGYHYRAQYEMILFFEKGKRKLNNFSISDVLKFRRIKSRNAYPTEKPVSLARVLIEQSTSERDVVLDPFMGSGAFGVAAVECGRYFIGNDLSCESVDITRNRLSQITMGLK